MHQLSEHNSTALESKVVELTREGRFTFEEGFAIEACLTFCRDLMKRGTLASKEFIAEVGTPTAEVLKRD